MALSIEVKMSEGEAREPRNDAQHLAEVQLNFVQNIEIVRGFVFGLLPDRTLADDVVQETFLEVTRQAAKFTLGTNFPKWACSIARFKAIESLRKARRHTFLDDKVLEVLSVSPEASRQDPRYGNLQVCLAKLSPRTKEILELRYGADHKPGEIATLLGLAAETVYSVLSRGHAALKVCLEKLHPPHPPGL